MTSLKDKSDDKVMHCMAENPATADSHKEPEILELRRKYYETTSCMCQFGMIGKEGGPLLKG